MSLSREETLAAIARWQKQLRETNDLQRMLTIAAIIVELQRGTA
jgi:hypothetical protein